MDCKHFAEIVHDLDRPGTEGAALRESALAHAESCGACTRLLMEAESLDFALRALAAEAASQAPRSELESRLLHEFRQEKAGTARRRARWLAAALSTAAAVLLALGLAWLHRPWPSSGGDSATVTPAPVLQPPAAQDVNAQAAQRSVVIVPVGEEDAAFVPLPYADDPEGLDGGAVVRVELSREALASLGWPVPEPGSGPFTADLVVSSDGTPQAIRLVSSESAEESL